MAVKYEEYFTKASQRYGVDKNLLIAVAKTESGIDAKAVSSAGAVGVMQLMPSTAKMLGVTNSYDAEQNIMGGAKYLSQLIDEFDGNTELALASYNAGVTRIKNSSEVPDYAEEYVKRVKSNYAESDRVGGGKTGAGTRDEVLQTSTELVWWGDIVRVVLILLVIAIGVILVVVSVQSSGVPTSPKDLAKEVVKGAIE